MFTGRNKKGRLSTVRESARKVNPEFSRALQLVAAIGSVFGEHLDRIERQLLQAHAQQLGGLRQDVMRDGDDGAAAFLGLEKIEDFARARPEQFGLGMVFE